MEEKREKLEADEIQPQKTEKRPDDNVEVKTTKGELRGMLKDLESDFQKKLEERDKKIQVLTEATDQTRLSKVLDARQGPREQLVKISTHNGKVIMGWETVTDIVEKDTKGIWHENQIMRMHFEDGESLDLHYRDFDVAHRKNKVECKVLSRTTDDKGNTTLKVKRLDNSKEYDIDVVFVN